MKDLELYEELELEVIPFSVEDVIRASTGTEEDSDTGDGGEAGDLAAPNFQF